MNDIVQLGERITVERLMDIRYGNPSPEFLKLPQEKRDAVARQSLQRYSPRTVATYNERLFQYQMFCATYDIQPFPLSGQVVSAFISEFAGKKTYKTIENYVAAIACGQRILGFPSIWSDPYLRDTLAGIRNEHGCAVKKQLPIMRDQLDDCMEQALRHPVRATALRNALICGMGFEIAGRGGEVRLARRGDLKRRPAGYTYRFPKSKTDRGGEGYTVAIVPDSKSRHNILDMLDEYLPLLPTGDGLLFPHIDRHGRIKDEPVTITRVNQIIKGLLKAAGHEPKQRSSHSLRAGNISQSTKDGLPDDEICKDSRHKSKDNMWGYQRLDADTIIERKITTRLGYGDRCA
jgi:integrase